jgi:predicted RNA-binding protein YlxR (DUF448 family)
VDTETMRDDREQPRRENSRTCVGCRARITGADLERSVRVVLGLAGPDGRHEVAVDLAGGSFGRGAHIHATSLCIAKACAGGFSHAFKCKVGADAAEVARTVVAASGRRIEGLLLGARRAGLLAFGEDAKQAVAGGAPLVLAARDAGESALGGPLRQAVADGRVLAWRTKEELGRLFSREVVAIVAVRHAAVAREIRSAATLAESVGTTVTGS